jgi:hypothetical protein
MPLLSENLDVGHNRTEIFEPNTVTFGSHEYPVGTATSNSITIFSPVITVVETALIDSSVIASLDVA